MLVYSQITGTFTELEMAPHMVVWHVNVCPSLHLVSSEFLCRCTPQQLSQVAADETCLPPACLPLGRKATQGRWPGLLVSVSNIPTLTTRQRLTTTGVLFVDHSSSIWGMVTTADGWGVGSCHGYRRRGGAKLETRVVRSHHPTPRQKGPQR